jgi:hypothetical protein
MNRRFNRWVVAVVFGLSFSSAETWWQRGRASAAGGEIFPLGTRPDGYKLGLLATACWMGGVWSDAEGALPDRWAARDEQRCRDLVISVYGRFDQARFEQIRENEDRAVGDLLAKIRATEPAASRDRTVALFRDVAAAAHEGMLARRAADRVKIDYDADAVEAKLTGDQRTAAKALAEHGALERLLVAPEASAADRRVLGLLFAMDRMEIARGLPKQLKLYAVGHVFTDVFDAAPPPANALKPTVSPRPGTWLTYLAAVAERAGYPTLESPALTPKMRETLAWTGVGHGFADRLRERASALPVSAVPELSRVATSVATRLETERATAQASSNTHATREGGR